MKKLNFKFYFFFQQINSYDGNLTLYITFESDQEPSEQAEAIIIGNGITLIWKEPISLQSGKEQVNITGSSMAKCQKVN